MKTKLTFLLFLFLVIGEKSLSQYYEKSYQSGSTQQSPTWIFSSGNPSMDRFGNTYRWYINEYSCMNCQAKVSYGKTNVYTGKNWGLTFPFGVSYATTARAFEDNNRNTYMIWQQDGILNFGGGSYDVTGGYAHALFKYDSTNVLKWIVDFEDCSTIYTDVNNNLYTLNNARLLRKIDSTGATVDSIQFSNATIPSFMDSLGNFYKLKTDTIVKSDWAGNIIWIKNIVYTGLDYSMQGPHIFLTTTDSIYELELSGNVTAYNNYAASTGIRFDLNGNYYQNGPNKKYNLTTGLVYDLGNQVTGYGSGWMDMNGHFYRTGFYTSTAGTDPILFCPPNVYYNPMVQWAYHSYQNYFTHKSAWWEIFSTDVTQRNITFNLYYNYQGTKFCTKNKMDIAFGVDKYPVSIRTAGYNIELSDSSGSFASARVIGTRNCSPITITIPDSIAAGDNYKIRIVPNDSTFTASGNIINNVKIRTSPVGKINFTNAVFHNIYQGYPVSVAQCDSSLLTAQSNPFPVTKAWHSLYFSGNPIQRWVVYQNLGNQDTMHKRVNSWDIVRLTITDSIGCAAVDSVYIYSIQQAPQYPYSLYLADTVNINSNPLEFTSTYYNNVDSAYGNGVYMIQDPFYTIVRKYFYPDSAGPGWHYVYANLKPSNYVGIITCNEDSLVDSIYVSSTPFARIETRNVTKCSGDSVHLNFKFHGSPPFIFSVKTNASPTPIGPFITFSSTYTLVVNPLSQQQYSVGYFEDDNGIYANAWNGTVHFKTRNFQNPVVSTSQPTSFCEGDSALLVRNNVYPNVTYQWYKNNIAITGVTGTYFYAKTRGSYSVKFDSLGCSVVSNSIFISVPCIKHTGGGNTPLRNTENNLTDNSSDLFYVKDEALVFESNDVAIFTHAMLKDITGRSIAINKFNKSNDVIEVVLPLLSKGIYLVTFYSEKRIVTRKFFAD